MMAEEIAQIRENYLKDKADGFKERSEDSYHYTNETFLQEMFERDFLLSDDIYQELCDKNNALEKWQFDFNAATVSGMMAFILHQAEERRFHTGLFELFDKMEDLVYKYAWDYLNETYLGYDECEVIGDLLKWIIID
jgi:hypothetical protein